MSTENKATLFLDVDGVIYPDMRRNKPAPKFRDDWIKHRLKVPHPDGRGRVNVNLRYSPTVISALTDLRVDIEWLTTWQAAAPKFLGPIFEWPTYPAFLREDTPGGVTAGGDGSGGWWKARSLIAAIQERPRPFIWADNEINPDSLVSLPVDGAVVQKPLQGWLDAFSVPHLLVVPDERLGLLNSDLERMDGFVAAL